MVVFNWGMVWSIFVCAIMVWKTPPNAYLDANEAHKLLPMSIVVAILQVVVVGEALGNGLVTLHVCHKDAQDPTKH